MPNLKKFVSEHKRGSLVALFVLIVFVGFSATSALNVASRRTTQSTAQTTSSADPTTSAASESDGGSVSLTDSQRQAISGYDDTTKEFIETLDASVWSADGGKYTLRFGDDTYTETVDGQSEQHSFAITRLVKDTDSSGAEADTVVFETDTGTHVVTYTNTKGTSATDGTGQISSMLSSSSMFSLKDTSYERAEAVENITVKGLNSEVTTLLGGDADAMTAALSRWCATNYPTVTEADWSQVASIDWKSQTVSTAFNLNAENPVSVTVVYKMDTGDFSFGL